MAEETTRTIPPVLQMYEAQYKRNHWALEAAKGLSPQDVMAQGFYGVVAAKLKPWDRIEITAEDGTWVMDVLVLEASRAWARVYPLSGPHFLTSADVSQSQAALEAQPVKAAKPDVQPTPKLTEADFDVMHRGPRKWSVVRKADREVMHEEEQTKGGAQDWLKAYLQRTPAPATA